MAFSLNKVCLIGNLGKDAEHRFTTNNKSVTSFSIATTESYKDRSGNWQNNTTWHNLVAFELSDYQKGILKKGKKVYVEGKISKRDYENKEGVKIYVTEVIVDKYSLIPLDNSDNESSVENYNHFEKPVEEDDPLPF